MSQYIIRNGELYHHGVKGMKWGVRRYQNDDGSLTERGKKRYLKEDAERRELERKTKVSEFNRASKGKLAEDLIKEEALALENEKKWNSLKPKEKSGIEKTKDLIDSTADMARSVKSLMNMIPKKKTQNSMDLSNMSDKEMREAINRAMLEKQYSDMFAPQSKSKGREYVRTALEIGGSVLAVGSTALSIALAVKGLKG